MKKEEVVEFLRSVQSVAWYEDMQVAVDPLHEVRIKLFETSISIEFGVTEVAVLGTGMDGNFVGVLKDGSVKSFLVDAGNIGVVDASLMSESSNAVVRESDGPVVLGYLPRFRGIFVEGDRFRVDIWF